MSASRLVLNDREAQRFEINRAALVDPAIFAAEKERIFERCWLYVGHESEVRAPGDFCTRSVCGRPLILCRDSENALRVFLNTCRHRGTVVCREASGNAQRYRRSLTAGHPKSTPKASAKNFASGPRLLFRRLFSRLIQEISWIGTRATTFSWTRCFHAG